MVLALKGTRRVLQALKENGPMKYKELVAVVGFSTTTSRCLKAMESHHLVTKKVLSEPYRPVEYKLTERGDRLLKLALDIEKLAIED